MRHVLVVALGACALAMSATTPASAVGVRHPFCIQGDEYPGLSNCTFDSYDACAASASGRFLYCIPNPFFASEGDDVYAYPSPYPARRKAARPPRYARPY
jgi:uncharacterized protein DUF3551